jgi:hypothetical protein
MTRSNHSIGRIKMGLGLVLALALTGCFGGYVDEGYAGYGGYGYDDGGADVYLFGGNYDRGRDVHAYSHRGAESRASVHSGGGHVGGHRGR